MKFLREKRANNTVEWIVGLILVVSIVGSMIYSIAHSSNAQGGLTNGWINSIPAPTTP
jgi:hypothetical protein